MRESLSVLDTAPTSPVLRAAALFMAQGVGAAHERETRLCGPPLYPPPRRAGAGTADVAGEGVRDQVLAGAVQLELARHLSALLEGVPGQLVDLLVVLPPLVGHDQEHVVAAVADVMVDEEPALLGLPHLLAASV